MTREEKNQFIDTLAEKLTNNNHFYLTDVSGLTAGDSNTLRRLCFNRGVSLQVVKNTLLKNAMEKAQAGLSPEGPGRQVNYKETYSVLKGNTAIIFSEVGNVPAKLIRDFRKKYDKPVLKVAYVEDVFYFGDEQLSILSNIKSKNEIIGDIIGLLQSPVKNVISALQSGGNKLSAILKTLSEKVQEVPKKEAKAETDAVEASTADKETGAAPAGEATGSVAEETPAEAEETNAGDVGKIKEVKAKEEPKT